jgi:hypothetical protein
VVVVEVTRKAYLASLVPVIVDAILGEHQVIADIVAFVSHGDFPRSRLGEKQRGKVLASWVTRKLRTIAQFSIRDMEGSMSLFAEAPQHRSSKGSKPGSIMGNSLRRSTLVPDADSATVPRSPAPVLVEQPEASMVPPYHDVHETEGAEMPAPPLPDMHPSLTHIVEPVPPMRSSNNESHSTGIAHPDLGFNFGDFANATSSAPMDEHTGAGAVSEALPYRDVRGQGSIPAQQPPRTSSLPVGTAPSFGRPKSPDHISEDKVGDWPQEALMYQSALGVDDAYGHSAVNRSLSDAMRNHHD